MKKVITSILVASLIILAGCSKTSQSTEGGTCGVTPDTKCETPAENPDPKIDMTNKDSVIAYAINAIKTQNMEQLTKVVSKDGVRFSPYSYIDLEKGITLQKDSLKEALSGSTEYVRGTEDGTGDPIILTFKDYFKKYVYDIDFEKLAEKHIDNIMQRGNTVNNINDVYSGASTIEFYIPGINPEYAGMDRRSLTLVLQQEDKERKVKAIVHSQWTI